MTAEQATETDQNASAQPKPPRDSAQLQWLRIGLLAIAGLLLAILVTGGVYYHRCARKIDERLASGVLQDASDIYGAPVPIQKGDTFSDGELKSLLESAGYKVTGDESRLEAAPGPQNAGSGAALAVSMNASHQITRIESAGHSTNSVDLGPIPIANVSVRRDKREIVTFDQIPHVLVQAVLAAEDKRFFHHDGVDLERVLKATWVDFRTHRKEQGASTLTMQLVRNIWLGPDKTWRRKIEEIMMTAHLERTWSKKEIFAHYANQVYLGRQSAYNLHGFAEGSRVFFGKPLADLTLPEAALLAGMVQRPSYFNPLRNSEAATERRNLVLEMMRSDKFITEDEYESAVSAPIGIHEGGDPAASHGAPYYLDQVAAELETSGDHGAKSVYTTIDPRLQQAASEAIASGMKEVDRQLASRYAKSGHRAEAALIALDPHTGEIKALVGGRDYSASQLNRILANRPPGSVFKPFVYAAAIESGMDKSGSMMTEASMVDDSPASISWNRSQYQPKNFKGETYGNQMLIDALAHSDNVAAVKVAEQVGLDKVVAMARRVGLNSHIQATPAVALGAYAVTPLEVAGAYTAFANGGILQKPHLISEIRDSDGDPVRINAGESRKAISPEVAAVMVTMLQQVVQSGTAASVRSRGFTLPAAGKTGTSHDGWFAGFTTRLLCVVWVGFDDYSDLNLEGAKSALPIWTAFMKEAANFTPFREAGAFSETAMLDKETVCPQSGLLASDQCPVKRAAYFISGTAPQAVCTMHNQPAPVVDAPDVAPPTATPDSATVQTPAVAPASAAAPPAAPESTVPGTAALPSIPVSAIPVPAPPPSENPGPPL